MSAVGRLAFLMVLAFVAVSVSGSHSPSGLDSCTPTGHGDCATDEPVETDFSPQWPHPAAACSEPYHIQWAGWDLCWQQDDVRVQGLEINRAFFHNESVAWKMGVPFTLTKYERPTGPGPFKDVLGRPGDANLPGYGLGSLAIEEQACPRFFGSGQLINDGHICLEHRDGVQPATAIWARYDVFNYRFLQGWIFDSRGNIEPLVATGGHLIDGGFAGAEGQNHHHHIYWRIDFDMADPGNDVFQVFKRVAGELSPVAIDPRIREVLDLAGDMVRVEDCEYVGGITATAWCDVVHEAKLEYEQRTTDKWRVVDDNSLNGLDRPKGFEFFVHSDSSPDAFSTFDVMVLEYKGDSSEIGYEVVTTPTRGDDRVAAYAQPSETINDPVVWVVHHGYHDTRDEDRDSMSHHYSGFELRPRNFMDENPGEPTFP